MKLIPLYLLLAFLVISATAKNSYSSYQSSDYNPNLQRDPYGYDYMDLDEEDLLISMIKILWVVGGIAIFIYAVFHLLCLWQCLKMRNEREKIKSDMSMKRATFKATLGAQEN